MSEEVKIGSRASRSSENRFSQGRSKDNRPFITFGDGSKFNVPKEVIESDPEHSYHFVPYQSGGDDLINEYEDAIYGRGMMPVKCSEHPSLRRHVVDGPFKRSDDDLYKIGGQILMKRPKEIDKAEQAYFDERNSRDEYIRSLHSNVNPGSPKMFQDERRWNQR